MFEDSGATGGGSEDEWAVPGVGRGGRDTGARIPSEVVAALLAGVEALQSPGADVLDEQLLVDTRALMLASQRLQAKVLSALAEVDARRAYRREGVATTGRWVAAQQVELDPRQLALARAFGRFPAVAGKVRDGSLSLVAARQLQLALGRAAPHLDAPDGLIDGQPGEQALTAVVVDGVRTVVAQARGGFPTDDDPVLLGLLADLPAIAADTSRTQLQRFEDGLLVLAQHVEAAQLPGALGLLTDALLPGLLQDRADRGHDGRGLSLVRDPDGSGWTVRGDLDLECGEKLWLVLRSELTRDLDAPLDTAQAAELREQGVDPYDPDLPSSTRPRSRRQTLHDAFSHGLSRYLAADLGGVTGKDRVQIIVRVPIEALDRAPGAVPAATGSGAVLPAGLVRRLSCSSPLTRHVLDLRGRVVADSHTQRTLTRSERRAKETETGGQCQGAGCRSSTRHADTLLCPHHATPWARCGTTSLSDTVLLCEGCHHDVHDGRRRLLLRDGRRLGPDGWIE